MLRVRSVVYHTFDVIARLYLRQTFAWFHPRQEVNRTMFTDDLSIEKGQGGGSEVDGARRLAKVCFQMN